jgi:uncharacterized protein YktB (UPF0637 family)
MISTSPMMFTGFETIDFEVFDVPGLDERMAALKAHLRIKLQQLGVDFANELSKLCGVTMYAHVAKHARRTVNPPNDSWVAFCPDKRGYKKHPHFQIGAWGTHAFATFGLIYESPLRHDYAAELKAHAEEIVARIPSHYVWIPNHMDPNAIPANQVDSLKLHELATQLAKGRQGELLVGVKLSKNEAIQMNPDELESVVRDCFQVLLPLYKMAVSDT